jgi:hypothetical protein
VAERGVGQIWERAGERLAEEGSWSVKGGNGVVGSAVQYREVVVEKKGRGSDGCGRENAGSQGLLGKAAAREEG